MSEDSLHSKPAPARRKRARSMAPEQRRRQLVEVAMPLMAQHGGAMTTSQVASAAGVAEGTIFRLFPDKDSLLTAVLDEALDCQGTVLKIHGLPKGGAVLGRVAAAAELVCGHFRVALPVMHGALHQSPSRGASQAVGEMFRGLLEAMNGLFADEVGRARIEGDPVQLARILVGICQSMVWQEFFDHDPGRMTTQDVVQVLLRGCQTESDRGAEDPWPLAMARVGIPGGSAEQAATEGRPGGSNPSATSAGST